MDANAKRAVITDFIATARAADSTIKHASVRAHRENFHALLEDMVEDLIARPNATFVKIMGSFTMFYEVTVTVDDAMYPSRP